MEIDIKTVGDVVLYLGGVAAALGAIGVVLRFAVLNPLKRWITEQVGNPVQEIRHEVTPDHADPGSSMKDDLAGVREGLDALNKHLTTHIEATAPRDWRITALEIRMDETQARLHEHFRIHPGPTPTEGT